MKGYGMPLFEVRTKRSYKPAITLGQFTESEAFNRGRQAFENGLAVTIIDLKTGQRYAW